MGFINNLFRGSKKPVRKEFVGDFQRFLNGGVTSGVDSKFARDIFTRQRLTIHEEFVMCKESYRENSLIHSSIDTMSDLIKGDKFRVETDNDVLKKYLENHYFQESGFVEAVSVAVKEALITGNGYIEVLRDSSGAIRKLSPIVNSEDIYIDYDYKKDKVKRYIQKVYLADSKDKSSLYNLDTPYGMVSVRGFEIPADRLVHLKYGNNSWGVYGRSDIAAVLDDLRILKTIERSIAVISKYKAIPKKALMVEIRENEEPLSPEEFKVLADTLKTQSDYENPLFNRKMEALDLSSGGSDIRMEGYIDYLKRNITVNMAPEFLIHGQEVNRATSREQKQTYFLRVSSKRYPMELVLTKLLTMCVNSLKNPSLNGTLEFKFGEYDIELPEEKEAKIQDRWSKGLITLKEAREELGLPEVGGTDVFNWEISNEPSIEEPTTEEQ